nr:reverse transcriptase domain-containing protein [Tanacetum cinerariifolium]
MTTNEQTPLSNPPEKLHQEKAQHEKHKAVKARLNFEETSWYSESKTLSRRRNLKERFETRYARTKSGSLEPRHGRSKSPREKDPKRRTVFRRLEKCVFHRLGDNEKNVSAHLRGSEQKSYYSSRRDTESCYQSSRSKETEISFEKHRHKREYSRRTEAVSESEGSAGGHWKSKSKKQKSNVEDDLSQPWVCKETDPFTPRICYFDFPKAQMPSHIKTYDGKANRRNAKGLKTLTFDQGIKEKPWKRPGKDNKKGGNLRERQTAGNIHGEEDGTKGPMIIEAEMGGHCVHRMYVDEGSSSKILYEHYFSKFRSEIKNQLILTKTPLVGFSGEIIWPLGQISLLVKIGDEEHSTSAWINLRVVRSPSPYNRIIGRPRVRKIRAIPSTAHEMLKFPVAGGIVTLQSSRIILLECPMVSEPGVPQPVINQVPEEKIQVAIRPKY